MSSQRDKILDRVRKLKALAENSSASVGEIENAMAAARRLIDEWGIDDEELVMSDTAQEGIKSGRSATAVVFTDWQLLVAMAVSSVTDTEVLHVFDGQSKQHLDFVGFESDVVMADTLYKIILAQVRALATHRCGAGWTRRHTSYTAGVAIGLNNKANELRLQRIQAAASAGAIVVRKDALIKNWIHEQYKDVRSGDHKRVDYDLDMLERGKQDAKDISLDTRGLGESDGPSPKLLG